MSKPITPKQRDYLEGLWERLGKPTSRIRRMSCAEASIEIDKARKALGQGKDPDAEYDRGYSDGYRDGCRTRDRVPPVRSTPTTLPPDLLGDLVQLCHPDRHPPERAERANRATAVLLELVQLERGAA